MTDLVRDLIDFFVCDVSHTADNATRPSNGPDGANYWTRFADASLEDDELLYYRGVWSDGTYYSSAGTYYSADQLISILPLKIGLRIGRPAIQDYIHAAPLRIGLRLSEPYDDLRPAPIHIGLRLGGTQQLEDGFEIFRHGVLGLFPHGAPYSDTNGEARDTMYGIKVPGVNGGKPLPILAPWERGNAARVQASNTPGIYGELNIRQTECETTVIGGGRYTARGTANVFIYARENKPLIAQNLDRTAKAIIDAFTSCADRGGRLRVMKDGERWDFRVYFHGVHAEDQGAQGANYNVRVTAPFTYHGPQRHTVPTPYFTAASKYRSVYFDATVLATDIGGASALDRIPA